MRKLGLPIFIFFVFFVLSNSCNSPSSVNPIVPASPSVTNIGSSSSGSATRTSVGFLKLVLKDKPISEAQNIFVTINKISVHMTCEKPDDCDFIDVYENATGLTLDLLVLKNTPEVLFSAELEAGKYNQVRISVISGEIVFPPETLGGTATHYPLDIPSSEIKVPVQFEIATKAVTSITLDFDTKESIHIIQKGKNDTYLLRPVIHVAGIM